MPCSVISIERCARRTLAAASRGEAIDAQKALRKTSDTLLQDLDALGVLEDEKRMTPQGDPRLVELAARIEEIAARVLKGSRQQLELSHEANATAEAGIADPAATIATTERNVNEVLTEWRAAERAAREAMAGSVEEHEARTRAERLRDEYRDAFDRARQRLER